MSSLHKNQRSRYWYYAFRDADGSRAFKSTRETNKTAAMRVGLVMEDAAKSARHGHLTAAHLRKVIAETVAKVSGEAQLFHSIGDWCRSWAAGKKLSKSEGTAKRYGPVIEDFLTHLGSKADKDIAHLSMFHIQAFRDEKIRSGLSAASVNLAIKTLRTCLKKAVHQELIASNPADAVDLLEKNDSTKKAFTRDQVHQILQSTKDVEWHGLIMTGYYIGSRISNCARLRFEEVDFEQQSLTYTPVKQRKGKKLKTICIPIHPQLFEYFVTLQSRSGLIFPRLSQMRVGGMTGLSLTFRSLMKDAGIVCEVKEPSGKGGRKVYDLSFHSLRHAFNSDLANHGVSQEIRQKLIGHASEAVNDGYTSIEMRTFKEAIHKLPRLGA